MKKVFIILSFLGCQLTQAQTEKGNILLGASVNYSQGKSKYQGENTPDIYLENKNSNVNENVRVGYFFANNFAAGVLLTHQYSLSSQKNVNNQPLNPGTTDSKNIGNTINAGLFLRGYKTFAENKFAFFYELSGSYVFGRNNGTTTVKNNFATTITKSHNDISGFNVGIRPGFTYFITKKIGLEASVGNLAFNSQKTEAYDNNNTKTSTTTHSNFDFNLSAATLYIGATFYLGGK